MSLEDARYSVIRYLASDIENAYGPNVHDPRSGEIIESHIGWFHNVMSLVHDWYMIQAGCMTNVLTRWNSTIDWWDSWSALSVHMRVGHTPDFAITWFSSTTLLTVHCIRNWVEANGPYLINHGHARFNHVAQPEDNISRVFSRINDYDKVGNKMGMLLPNCKNSEDENRSSTSLLSNSWQKALLVRRRGIRQRSTCSDWKTL